MGMGFNQYTTVRKFKINWTTFLKNCSDIVRNKKNAYLGKFEKWFSGK